MEQSTKKPSLGLSDEELGKISQIARDNKFEFRLTPFVYAEDFLVRTENFLKGYRFLFNLKNSVSDEIIKGKVASYLDQLEPKFSQALELWEKHRTASHFTLHRQKRKIFQFYADNHEIIDDLIDAVVPIGRIVKQYDPGQAQGYY